jgi:hypothetical protein
LFLFGFEPLNKLIATRFVDIMYVTTEGIMVGPVLFADENLSPTNFSRLNILTPLQAVNDCYTGVSVLNIDVRKSSALCIKSLPELIQELQQRGFTTPDTIRHLDIELGKTMRETMQKIYTTAVKRRIPATTPLMDIRHRATLINSAMVTLQPAA